MGKDFIESGLNRASLDEAHKQQEQLLYFTKSKIQTDVTLDNLRQWADRNYRGSDYFLNWLKNIFMTDNFLSVYKYMRYPLPSSRLVNSNIKPALMGVLNSEDSYFEYVINGVHSTKPMDFKTDTYSKRYFSNWMFRTNDVYVMDLDIKTGKGKSILIDIGKVIALDHDEENITKIAFTSTRSTINSEGVREDVVGKIYIDSNMYAFYDSENELVDSQDHNLGFCPAVFVGTSLLDNDFIIKESIFSYLRPDLEEYTFLKTLQKMTEPNSAFPVVSVLDTQKNSGKQGQSISKASSNEPSNFFSIGSQKSKETPSIEANASPTQAGSVLEVPIESIQDVEGKVNMDIAKNYITYFYPPKEILSYIDTRIKDIEKNIIKTAIGTSDNDSQEGSKSDLHIGKTFVSMEDRLRNVSQELSLLVHSVETTKLSLEYGSEKVWVNISYGTKFYMQSEKELLSLYEKAPNPLERKNILKKISRSKNKFNPKGAERDNILYDLLPYSSDIDFDKAIDRGIVDNTMFQYQTRFDYWINKFEASYGDIVIFYESIGDVPSSEKIEQINDLILIQIKKDESN